MIHKSEHHLSSTSYLTELSTETILSSQLYLPSDLPRDLAKLQQEPGKERNVHVTKAIYKYIYTFFYSCKPHAHHVKSPINSHE